MSPELLLLRRALDEATPDDYVDWAVAQIAQDVDGPNLRILAGLHRVFDRHEVEHYFLLSCEELGVEVRAKPSVLDAARMARSVYERGEITANETVDTMGSLYRMSDCQEELLAPWDALLDALVWDESCLYGQIERQPLDAIVRRELSLLDRALALSLPRGWLRKTRCAECWHDGKPRVVQPSLGGRVLGILTGTPVGIQALCTRCGSERQGTLRDPDARAAYFDSLERSGK
jgi:hypothetical protein